MLNDGGCIAGITMTATQALASYDVRFDNTPGGYTDTSGYVNTWITSLSFPDFPPLGPRDDSDSVPMEMGGMPGYSWFGFLAIQHLVNLWVPPPNPSKYLILFQSPL